jgi:CrcB protein
MTQILAIATGGALGALLRYFTVNGVAAWLGRGFPYGTLLVNVSGCLLMGLLYVLLVERSALAPEWRLGLLTGVLGAYTTFSAFSIETLQLFEEVGLVPALANVALSVVLCLLAVWLGAGLGRQL